MRKDSKLEAHEFGLTEARFWDSGVPLQPWRARDGLRHHQRDAGIERAGAPVAGKTGTAQNPHGLDHRWFIAMAPAEHPELRGRHHGERRAAIRWWSERVLALRRYILGPDSTGAATKVQISIPEDGAVLDAVGDLVPTPPTPTAREPRRAAREGRRHRSPAPLDQRGPHDVWAADSLRRGKPTFLPTRPASGSTTSYLVRDRRRGRLDGRSTFPAQAVEWLAPALYFFALMLLVLVLAVGTGAGTARSAAAAGCRWADIRSASRRVREGGPVLMLAPPVEPKEPRAPCAIV